MDELVAAVCCGNTFSHRLLEVKRTLMCDDASLQLLVSILWDWCQAAFAPLFQAIVPLFHR